MSGIHLTKLPTLTVEKPKKKRSWFSWLIPAWVYRTPGTKVSELEAEHRPSDEDVLLIADISEQKSKKISLADLKAYINSK